jgi:hypothetical protein
MVWQVHHDRLDLPLVLRLAEGCAPFKSFYENYALREPAEAYAGEFGDKNAA